MTWQEKLNSYKTDKHAARQEVLRAKDVYNQEFNSYKGDGLFSETDRGKQINHWANQVRNSAGLSEQQYGANVTGQQAKENFKTAYNPIKQVNTDQYRTQSATVEDIASKYGFDYTREDAKRQAEAEAQARRNAIEEAKRKNESLKQENVKSIDNNIMSAAEGMDHSYFQKYLQQQQGQVNNGLNAGIAADQNLRLAMNRQAQMGDVYRDANLGKMKENNRYSNQALALLDQLGLVNQQAVARESSLYNDQLKYLAGMAMQTDQMNQAENARFLQAALQQRGQDIGQYQFMRNFEHGQAMDNVANDMSQQRIDNQSSQYWNSFNNLSAAQQTQADQYWNSFNKLSAAQQEQFRQQALNRSAQQQMTPYQKATLELRQQELNNSLKGSESEEIDIRPKIDTYNEFTSYFKKKINEMKEKGDFPGAIKIEEELRNNPEAIDAFIKQGHDFSTVINALYNAAGGFESKEDYLKYAEKLKENNQLNIPNF